MDKYIQAEKRLAELLGWSELQWHILRQEWLGNPKDSWPFTDSSVSKWCRDDAAAFRLMVEHGIYPCDIVGTKGILAVSVQKLDDYSKWVHIDDHPDKATAVRYAIVCSTIAKLEAHLDTALDKTGRRINYGKQSSHR